MPGAHADRITREGETSRILDLTVIGLFCMNALLFILTKPLFPSQDLPDWVYQGMLLARLMQGDTITPFSLLSYPVPNTTAILLLGFMNSFMPPLLAGKLVVLCATILLFAGSWALFRSLPPERSRIGLLIACLYLLNTSLFSGNVNYLLALGMLLLLTAIVVRNFGGPVGGQLLAAMVLLSLLLFFTHGLVFLTWCLFAGLASLVRGSGWSLHRAIMVLGLPLLMAGWYALQSSVSHPSSLPLQGGVVDHAGFKLASLYAYLAPYSCFYPYLDFGQPWIRGFGVLNAAVVALLLTVILCGAFLLFRRYSGLQPVQRWLMCCVLALLLAALSAPRLLLNVVDAGGRLWYPILWLALLLMLPILPGRLISLLRGSAVLLVLATMLHSFTYAGRVAERLDVILTEWSTLLDDPETVVIDERFFQFEGELDRGLHRLPWMPGQNPTIRLHDYLHGVRGWYSPIMETSLLGERDKSAPSLSSSSALRRWDGRPRLVLITGQAEGCVKIAEILGTGYTGVRVEQDYVLLRRGAGDGGEPDVPLGGRTEPGKHGQ